MVTRLPSPGRSLGESWISQLPVPPIRMHAPLLDLGGCNSRTAACSYRCCLPHTERRRLPLLQSFRGSITQPTCSSLSSSMGRLPYTTWSYFWPASRLWPGMSFAILGRYIRFHSRSPEYRLRWRQLRPPRCNNMQLS